MFPLDDVIMNQSDAMCMFYGMYWRYHVPNKVKNSNLMYIEEDHQHHNNDGNWPASQKSNTKSQTLSTDIVCSYSHYEYHS